MFFCGLLRAFVLRFLRFKTASIRAVIEDQTNCQVFLPPQIVPRLRPSIIFTTRLNVLRQLLMSENEISYQVIGCAIKVHTKLGPGLLESAYEACLYHELSKANLFVERQKPIPLIYEQVKLDCGYRADLIVEKKLIIEIKAVEALNEIHLMQALTHIKLLDYRLGLLINFNVLRLPEGLRRIANNFKQS